MISMAQRPLQHPFIQAPVFTITGGVLADEAKLSEKSADVC
jgi:hypothetical protein